LDYTIHSPELRLVDFTAAAKGNSTLLAGDATAVAGKKRKLRSA